MPPDAGYQAATDSVALADRSDRARIEVTGPDRAKVLHNLTTNEIKRLGVGLGREAFVTTGQGKTIALVSIHALADALLVRSDPGAAGPILAHLGKYGLFEDARFADVTASTAEWHLAGPRADEVLGGIGPPTEDLALVSTRLADLPIRIVRESPTGRPGLTVIAPIEDREAVADRLRAGVEAVGGSRIEADAFEALRIEAGTPATGREVGPDNLPQEIDRDARAISFVKGCYLGQETVARLDAMGHVNKILIGAVGDCQGDPVPGAGSTLRLDGKNVGAITSAAASPGSGRTVALAIVRVAASGPGTVLEAVGPDGVVRLIVAPRPMARPG